MSSLSTSLYSRYYPPPVKFDLTCPIRSLFFTLSWSEPDQFFRGKCLLFIHVSTLSLSPVLLQTRWSTRVYFSKRVLFYGSLFQFGSDLLGPLRLHRSDRSSTILRDVILFPSRYYFDHNVILVPCSGHVVLTVALLHPRPLTNLQRSGRVQTTLSTHVLCSFFPGLLLLCPPSLSNSQVLPPCDVIRLGRRDPLTLDGDGCPSR